MSGPYSLYILAAYAVTAAVLGFLILESWLGLKRARARLQAIKTIAVRPQGAGKTRGEAP